MSIGSALSLAKVQRSYDNRAAVRRAGELLGVLAQHSFDGADPGRQTEALK